MDSVNAKGTESKDAKEYQQIEEITIKFGKGMRIKLPAEGHTTIQRSECIGEDADGKKLWENKKTKVTNRELKGMVEFYKTRSKDSIRQKLDEKKQDVTVSKSEPGLKPDRARTAGVSL